MDVPIQVTMVLILQGLHQVPATAPLPPMIVPELLKQIVQEIRHPQ
jgi:hypothetical protein